MSTDPKKNDEIKDEELDKVSGGSEIARPDEQLEGGPDIWEPPVLPVQDRKKI